MKVSVAWKENMRFEAANDSNDSRADMDSTDPELGGEGKGQSPKHMFLQSIAGCTAMDVIYILKKMREKLPDSFFIDVRGEVADEMPKVFKSINLVYNFKGKSDKEKLIKAVKLSQEKYCSISIMVRKICDFKYSVVLNGSTIHTEK